MSGCFDASDPAFTLYVAVLSGLAWVGVAAIILWLRKP